MGRQRIEIEPEGARVVRVGRSTVYLTGEFYYAGREWGVDFLDHHGDVGELQRLAEGSSPAAFVAAVEGMYCGFWVDEAAERAVAFTDTLNRRPFFIVGSDDRLLLTDTYGAARASLPTRKLNQFGMYSYLLLGYAPVEETLHADIARLGSGERLVVTAAGVRREREERPTPIREYDRADIDRYETLLGESVRSRASAKENVVMNSGGWDSTALVHLLTEHAGPSRVRSIVFDVRLSDGQSFNVYEVDKVRRISRFYGIETESCVIDYGDPASVDAWQRALPVLRDNHTFFWLHHMQLAAQIASRSAPGASVFSGEASDSIHNFGYSQFVSVNYPNMYLREYADKAKSYLYGPTFLRSINEGSAASDHVFQFFRSYYGADRIEDPTAFDETERLMRYVEAFVLSYPRVPFARWQNDRMTTTQFRENFQRHLRDRYFGRIACALGPETLYYYLLQLYRDFHFQSAQIGVANVALASHGFSCKIPFLDSRMLEYMYAMPESWGRGLELRPTKYPLRTLATQRWRMPIGILEEAGPHSYIAENDRRWTYAGGKWDIYCEILFNSVFASMFRDQLKTFRVDEYFDPGMFDVAAMQQAVDRYTGGKDEVDERGLIFKLALLSSIGV